MKNTWYAKSTGTHQGLIIEERTGANIAISYDKTNAPLIAAAPDLLEALQEVIAISDRKHNSWEKAKAALAKATEKAE